jgi:hypothetical protein
VAEFIQRRRLGTWQQNLSDTLSYLSGKNTISPQPGTFYMHAKSSWDRGKPYTLFQIRVTQDSVITIHPLPSLDFYVYDRDWVRMDSNPAEQSREWQVVEIESETPDHNPCFVFRLGSQGNRCIYEDWTGRVYVWKHAKDNTKCIWRLIDRNRRTDLYRRSSAV